MPALRTYLLASRPFAPITAQGEQLRLLTYYEESKCDAVAYTVKVRHRLGLVDGTQRIGSEQKESSAHLSFLTLFLQGLMN